MAFSLGLNIAQSSFSVRYLIDLSQDKKNSDQNKKTKVRAFIVSSLVFSLASPIGVGVGKASSHRKFLGHLSVGGEPLVYLTFPISQSHTRLQSAFCISVRKANSLSHPHFSSCSFSIWIFSHSQSNPPGIGLSGLPASIAQRICNGVLQVCAALPI